MCGEWTLTLTLSRVLHRRISLRLKRAGGNIMARAGLKAFDCELNDE
jgi:hypothetical protein